MGLDTSSSPKRLSPWTVLDDDGRHVIAINAYRQGRPACVVPDRQAFLAAFESSPDSSLPNCPSTIIAELERIGAMTAASDFPPPPHDHDQHGAIPFFGTIHLSVQLPSCSQQVVQEILRFAVEYATCAADWHLVIGVENAASLEQFGEFRIAIIDGLRRRHLDPGRVDWQLRVARLPDGNTLPRLIEEWPALQLFLEDQCELGTIENREREQARARELASSGFLLRPVLQSTCSRGLNGIVDSWQEATDDAGIILEPRVLDMVGSGMSKGLESPEEFDTAFEVIATISRTLGACWTRSDPWRSILATTAISGSVRRHWSKRLSSAHIDGSSRWARSRWHARAYLHTTASELVPRKNSPSSVLPRWHLRTGMPNCQRCPFSPLCDGYWSPELDVLARTGFLDRAVLVASLNCTIRKDVLVSLLAEIRADILSEDTRQTVEVVFEQGTLSLQEVSHGTRPSHK